MIKKFRWEITSLKNLWVMGLLIFGAMPSRGEDVQRFADFGRYAADNTALPADSEGRVVLMGNSITDDWPKGDPGLFENHPEIIGRGISGQTSYQFLLRFKQDVIDLHPEIVVINYGTNDIAENCGPYVEEQTFGNVKTMVDMASANGIKVILASCLPAEGFSWRPEIKDAMPKIRGLNAKVKEYAEAEGIPYIDYFSALVNPEGTALDSRYAYDHPAVHPNSEGYAVMETLLLEAIEKVKK